MSKLYFNEINIQDSSIPSFNNAIINLNKALYDVGELNIPEDFVYAYYLKQLCNKNFNSMQTLINKRLKLEKNIANYKKIEKEGINEFSNIEILKIPKRNEFKK